MAMRMVTLAFEFPQLSCVMAQGTASDAQHDRGASVAALQAGDDWAADLESLSGEEDGPAAGTPVQPTPDEGSRPPAGPTAPLPCASQQPAEVAPSPQQQQQGGLRARPHPQQQVAGDAIPSEVLLLVLSELRDAKDCSSAAAVCKHWWTVATLRCVCRTAHGSSGGVFFGGGERGRGGEGGQRAAE